jgi:hypothetical protein
MAMTDAERRTARLATYSRYNRSRKGKTRYQKYEAANPERATRWSPIMRLRSYDPLKGVR